MSKKTIINQLDYLISAIKVSSDFYSKEIIKEVYDNYCKLLSFLKADQLNEAKKIFSRLCSVPRGYLEVYSDWDNPLLIKIDDTNKVIDNYFSEMNIL